MNDHYKIIISALLIGLIASLVAGCSLLSDSQAQKPTPIIDNSTIETRVISEGNVVPSEYRHLSFASPGQVSEILVEKGQHVYQGEVLARLGDREQLEAAMAAAEYELQAAQQALENLNQMAELAAADAWSALLEAKAARIAAESAWEKIDTDDYQDDIDDATDEVLELEDDLEEAQKDFDRYKDLDEDHTTRKKYEDDLEEVQDDYNEAVRERDELIIRRDQAQAAVEQTLAAENQALDDYQATRDGPDPDQLALAQARLTSSRAQIIATQASLEDLELTAPFEGVIVDVNILENELVYPDVWAFLIADFSQLYVETNDLTELEVVKISLGQTVSLAPDALPELELTGKVAEISDDYRLQSGDILYDVRILIDQPDPRLRWGMTVEIVFNEE